MTDTTVQWVKTNMRDKPDGILCVCGNQTHIDGFWPANHERLMSPEAGSGWNGRVVCCLTIGCGRLIDVGPEHARPLPTNEKWDWSWEHPIVGQLTISTTTPIPGL